MRHFPPEPAPALAVRRAQTALFLELSRIQAVAQRRTAELTAAQGIEGITPAQANVLMVVFQARAPITARALARTLGFAEPTVSRLVKALEAAGWVARTPDPSDGRARLIAATAQARAALPQFIAVSNALLDEAFAGLDAAAVEGLFAGVRRLVANLDG